ncbi:MAG: ketoacyl-ACP synthase III [Puniceicoccales bacterium]|nr:ketoacyl-ACP synthase III [Puniceicoccales bacterium]
MGKPPRSVVIESIGHYLPHSVLTNADLVNRVDTSEEWIVTRTGIRERRLADASQASSDLAVEAVRSALAKGNVDPSTVDLLIVSTVTPDRIFPSTAAFIQAKVGLNQGMAFDLNATCSGFVYALEVGRQMMLTGAYRRALVVGTDKLSSLTDWEDRATCILFGDGAGAAILVGTDEPNEGLFEAVAGVDGTQWELLFVPAGGSRHPACLETLGKREHFIKMNGRELFKLAVRWMEKSISDLMKKHGLEWEQVDCIVPHQANVRICEALADRLRLPMDRFYLNIDRVGNTSSASIPIALSEALEEGRILPGHNVILASFGGGLTWAASLIKFPPKK